MCIRWTQLNVLLSHHSYADLVLMSTLIIIRNINNHNSSWGTRSDHYKFTWLTRNKIWCCSLHARPDVREPPQVTTAGWAVVVVVCLCLGGAWCLKVAPSIPNTPTPVLTYMYIIHTNTHTHSFYVVCMEKEWRCRIVILQRENVVSKLLICVTY